MPITSNMDKLSETKELRWDKKNIIMLWEHNGGGLPSTIARTDTTTSTWSVEGSSALTSLASDGLFESLNFALGGGYSQSKSFTATYSFQLEPGRTGRIVFVPMMDHVYGYLTVTAGGDIIPVPGGPPLRSKTITVVDHELCDQFYPTDGGQFELQYQDCVLYVDNFYQGLPPVVLAPGRYDWGTIPNDQISSLRVPPGIKVTLFEHVRFQGRSKVFTADSPYVGDDFNDITSSVIVESLESD
jgi:hypothetical protein